MVERLKNFFLHGMLATDELLGKPASLRKQAKAKEENLKHQEPIALEKEDRKALMIAAFQVFIPFILVIILIILGFFYLTARLFG